MALGADFVPLSVSLRKQILDSMESVRCNGQKVSNTAYLVGLGPVNAPLTSWASAQRSSTVRIKYYLSNSTVAKSTLETDSEDFGMVPDGLTPEWYARISDVALVPAIALAIGPGTVA